MPLEDQQAIFMNSTLVSKIPKGKNEEIRVSVLKNNKVDVRIYRLLFTDNEVHPTKKGIWLSFKDIPEIIRALEKLAAGKTSSLSIEIQNSKKLQTKVYTLDFKGKLLVHIRTFYLRGNEFGPGKGVSFPVEIAKQMAESLKDAEKFKE